MHSLRPMLRLLICALLAAAVLDAGAQQAVNESDVASAPVGGPDEAPVVAPEIAPAPVPEARIDVGGVAETRFNPTHGTIFFHVLGLDLADAGRDARVLVNDSPLTPGQTVGSARIVSASYRLPPGLSRIEFTGWDALGRPLRTESRIWAGDLALEVEVVDPVANALVEAVITVTLDRQPTVSMERVADDGRALFVDLPDERLRVGARDLSGRVASATVPARQGRLQLRLR